MKPIKNPATMTSTELQRHIAELREEITRLWVDRISGLADMLLVEAERHGPISRKMRIGYLLSPERLRLCQELAEEIVRDIEVNLTMAQLDGVRRGGTNVEVH